MSDARALSEPHGWRVAHYASLPSTNDEARRAAAKGDPGRLWVVAAEQTAGRGRFGRVWASPVGNLYASALLIDPCAVAKAPQLGFVAGVALARAADDIGVTKAQLKWPNDLVCGGAKIAGVLVESALGQSQCFEIIVGFGVNCASAPQGLAYPTQCLAALLGRGAPPEILFARLATRFDEALALWCGGDNFAAIRLAWLERAAYLGQSLTLSGPRGARVGRFEGLDASGRLQLRCEAGLEIIEAADVFFNPADNATSPAPSPKKAFS